MEDLTEEDKVLYNQIVKMAESKTLEENFYSASVAQKVFKDGSKLWKLQDKFKPFAEALQQFGTSMDVFANASSSILCPIWGCVRVVLHLAEQCGKYLEDVVSMFAQIGRVLPRLRMYEHLFLEHEPLLLALSDAYLDIIRFCIDAKKVFLKAKKTSAATSLACKILWRPFQRRFNEYILHFQQHQEEAEKQAGVAHMIEAKKAAELERADRIKHDKVRKATRRLELLALLSKHQYKNKHDKLRRLRHQGTGSWLLKTSPFKMWLDEPKSDCFCCFGIPGCGKTILASSLVDVLSVHFTVAERAICYHYCEYQDQSTLDSTVIIGTLIRQLIEQVDLTEEIEAEILQCFDQGATTPVVEQLIKLLLMAISRFCEVLVVLDGIDELDKEGQTTIVDLIRQLTNVSGTTIKVFTTSRREEMFIRKSLGSYEFIEMSLSHVSNDIAAYVHDSIESSINNGTLLISDADTSLKREVIDTLINGAHDMFLWVKFQIDEICEMVSPESIREALKNLPKDLAGTYARILGKIYDSPGGASKLQIARKVFRWIVFARRPLHIDELKEAVAVDHGDRSWDPKKISSDDGSRLIQACGSLVVFDREDLTVTLAHNTVRQFLMSSPETTNYPAAIHFAEHEAQLGISDLCITYLCFSDFQSQIMKAENIRYTTDARTAESIIWNSFPGASSFSKIMTSILRWSGYGQPQSQLMVNFSAVMLRKPPSEVLHKKYRLLNYVVSHWIWHTSALDQNIASWNRFRQLVFDRQLLFDIKPWESAPEQPLPRVNGLPYLGLFRWALRHGIVSLLELLTDLPSNESIFTYWDYDVRNDMHPITRACQAGQMNVIHFILVRLTSLAHGQEHDFIHDIKVIYQVASRSSKKILEALLTQSQTGIHWKRSPWEVLPGFLQQAAECGNLTAVENILALENDTFSGSFHAARRSSVVLASQNGHAAIVEALCRSDIGMSYITSAFEAALEAHHGDVAEVLLKNSPSPDSVKLAFLKAIRSAPLRESCPSLWQQCLDHKTDINFQDVTDHNRTALHHAVIVEDEVIVEGLLKNPSIDADARDSYGRTPLYSALRLTSAPSQKIIQLLVSHLCSQSRSNYKTFTATELGHGTTMLHIAAAENWAEVAEILLPAFMAYSKLKAKDVRGMTALDKASEAGSLECLDHLLEYEWSWEDCEHALSYAAKADQASAFSTLLIALEKRRSLSWQGDRTNEYAWAASLENALEIYNSVPRKKDGGSGEVNSERRKGASRWYVPNLSDGFSLFGFSRS